MRRHGSTVIARTMRAVRSEHQGRALCGQRPVREKETFFGDFLPFSKKLPASRRIAEAFALERTVTASHWIPAFAGMTSKRDTFFGQKNAPEA
jgi:hypothetical protein